MRRPHDTQDHPGRAQDECTTHEGVLGCCRTGFALLTLRSHMLETLTTPTSIRL
jgi:hypothetical protein